MSFLLDFFRQKVPKAGGEQPEYYRKALVCSEQLLAVYFVINILLFISVDRHWHWVPVVLLACLLASARMSKKSSARRNLGAYAAITLAWCGWYIHTFGWGCGGQHFLLPLLILVFFNVYERPAVKVAAFLWLIVYRMLLFYYSLSHSPVCALSQMENILFQMVNSTTLFIVLACLCILFSTNIQDTERQLRIDNQELHREAGTDPLTQLPNRRALLDEIDLFRKRFPEETFSVAIADIDFFKRVNDTYGHNCGDYALKALADQFRASANGEYQVCRWGGEEFCFFMPGMNLDAAGRKMNDLCRDVKRMQLCFEEHEFSITITIGAEENDFVSPLEKILNEADRKLYMGKEAGRDRVVL